MKLATGVDLIEISRIAEAVQRYGDRFLNRIFTDKELEEAGNRPASLAARFAAKEAAAKALGTGIGKVSWQEIEILREPSQQPVLHLLGAAARLAEQQNLTQWSLSLSHTQSHAVAVVIAIG